MNERNTMQHTPEPWKWVHEKSESGKWHAFLRGKANKWNDTLVMAMREDLAAFTYAIDTPNALVIEAAPELLAACEVIALTPNILGWLLKNDPQALRQVTAAIAHAKERRGPYGIALLR